MSVCLWACTHWGNDYDSFPAGVPESSWKLTLSGTLSVLLLIEQSLKQRKYCWFLKSEGLKRPTWLQLKLPVVPKCLRSIRTVQILVKSGSL